MPRHGDDEGELVFPGGRRELGPRCRASGRRWGDEGEPVFPGRGRELGERPLCWGRRRRDQRESVIPWRRCEGGRRRLGLCRMWGGERQPVPSPRRRRVGRKRCPGRGLAPSATCGGGPLARQEFPEWNPVTGFPGLDGRLAVHQPGAEAIVIHQEDSAVPEAQFEALEQSCPPRLLRSSVSGPGVWTGNVTPPYHSRQGPGSPFFTARARGR